MKRTYLSIDCETGGLGLDKSLLTLGLVLLNEEFKEIDAKQLFIKPDNGIYLITPKALEINGINLVEHDLKAKTYKETGTELYKLLDMWSISGKFKLIPIGKQIDGDLAQIFDKLMKRETWEMFVSYRKIEVSSVMLFLQDLGVLPEFKGSLYDCAKHYGISTEGLHDALVDARITAGVYKNMVNQINYKLESFLKLLDKNEENYIKES